MYSSLFGLLMNYRKILADFPLPQLFAKFVDTQRNHTQTVRVNSPAVNFNLRNYVATHLKESTRTTALNQITTTTIP